MQTILAKFMQVFCTDIISQRQKKKKKMKVLSTPRVSPPYRQDQCEREHLIYIQTINFLFLANKSKYNKATPINR